MKNRLMIGIVTGMTALSVWACGNGATQGTQASSETEAEAETPAETEAEAPAEAEAEAPAETEAEAPAETGTEAETPAQAEAVSDVIPTFTLDSYYQMDNAEDGTVLSSGSYEIVKLTEEAAMNFTTLNKTIEGENDELTERFKSSYGEIRAAAGSAYQDYDSGDGQFPKGELESRIEAVRCDGEILSLLETFYTYYPGAAHGITGYSGYNYNTSGAPVELTDVFKDPKALAPAAAENLISVSDGSKITDVDDLLKEAFTENYDNLTWVIDRDGVRFVFPPSDIAAYAAGTLEAKISFDKYPDLFTGNYGPAEGSFVKKLSDYAQTSVDLDGDGTEETILVTGISEEGENHYQQTALRIEINGQTFDTQEYFFGQTSYLVHTKDGRNYIYAVISTDNDYPILIVFEIKDKTPAEVGRMEGTSFAYEYYPSLNEDGLLDDENTFSKMYPMLDPENFMLGTRMNLMSTYSAQKPYKVGSDGMPEALTDYYSINVSFNLTTLQALTAEKVDAETGELTGEQGEIPAGTECTLWRTNGVDTVDIKLEDGSAYRFHIDMEGPITVNGVKLEEAFEGYQFAG